MGGNAIGDHGEHIAASLFDRLQESLRCPDNLDGVPAVPFNNRQNEASEIVCYFSIKVKFEGSCRAGKI